MIDYLKFALLTSVFHLCRGVVNAINVVGSVALAHAQPIAAAMPAEKRERIEGIYANKNKEWN